MSTIKGIFEPFFSYVTKQLATRKLLMQSPTTMSLSYSSEMNSDSFTGDFTYNLKDLNIDISSDFGLGKQSLRNTPAFRAFTTQKQCVVRMASGVDIRKKNNLLDENEQGLVGERLAKNWVLEGGSKAYSDFNSSYNTTRWRSNPTDGFGMVPPPGITDATIDTKSEDGSLREATINFHCHNRRQLEVLEALYMRPGYPVLLEWGWHPFVQWGSPTSSDPISIEQNDFSVLDDFLKATSTINGLNVRIATYKAQSEGNYDGFIGYVKNFSFKATEHGGYVCQTQLIAHGEILESLKTKSKIIPKVYTKEDEIVYQFATGSYSDQSPPQETFLADEFLFYLKSIKANADRAGDKAVLQYIGTEQERNFNALTEASAGNYYNTKAMLKDQYGITDYADPNDNPYLVVDPNAKDIDQDGVPDKFFRYLNEEGEGIPINKLNKVHEEYSDGIIDIIELVKDVAKITDDHITDSIEGWEHTARFPDEKYFTPTLWEKLWRDQTLFKRDFITAGLDPIFEGTILKEKYVDDEESNHSGIRKRLFVRWDLICQIINKRITPEYKENHSVMELTYLNPFQSIYTNRQNDKPNVDGDFKIESPHEKYYLQYAVPDGKAIFATDSIGLNVNSSDTPPSEDPNAKDNNQIQDGPEILDFNNEDFSNMGKNNDIYSQEIDADTGKQHPSLLGGSFDPGVCIMPHQIPHMQKNTKSYKRGFHQLTSFSNTKVSSTSIGLVYFNLDHLIKVYESIALEEYTTSNDLGEEKIKRRLKKEFSFHQFLTTIWNDVNGACGGFYDFGLHVEHGRPNVVRVIDFTFKGKPSDVKSKRPLFEFDPQGLSAITRDCTFSSKLDNDFASVISIAAQAPGDIYSLEAMSFKAFHKNIKNRFTTKNQEYLDHELQQSYDEYFNDLREYEVFVKSLQFYLSKMYQSNYETELVEGHNPERGDYRKPVSAETAVSMASKLEEMRNKIESRHAMFEDGYQNNIPGQQPLNKGTDYGMKEGEIRPYIGTYRENTTFSRSAIIPLTVSIKIDGIGGITPLQIFKINPEKLPIGYQNSNIVFIVKKEKNIITSGQDWTTEIDGYLTLLDGNPNLGENPHEPEDKGDTPETLNEIDEDGDKFIVFVNKYAWSAVFVSWCVEEAARRGGFEWKSSSGHTTFFQKNKKGPDFEHLDPTSTPLKKGDILLQSRKGTVKVKYPGPYSGDSHSDIVTDIVDGHVVVTGANLGDKIKQKTFYAGADGIMPEDAGKDSTHGPYYEGAILRNKTGHGNLIATVASEELANWGGIDEDDPTIWPALKKYYSIPGANHFNGRGKDGSGQLTYPPSA